MSNYYRINVSLNGRHYFATAKESIRDAAHAHEVGARLAEAFPAADGFKISCDYIQSAGREFDLNCIASNVTGKEMVNAFNCRRDKSEFHGAHAKEFRGFTFTTDTPSICFAKFYSAEGESISVTLPRIAALVFQHRHGILLPTVPNTRVILHDNSGPDGDDVDFRRVAI